MNIIISFDSEDILTPEADDAEKWWAEELSVRGIRGSFQCVSEMLRALTRRGRDDVIEAIAKHETGYHTNYHSIPPTHPEALEGKGLAESVDWVLRYEASGIQTHLETFGRVPISYCSPGDSWTPATLIAMAACGIKVFCDTRISWANERPFWYCGLLAVHYDQAFEHLYAKEEGTEEAFRSRFEEIANRTGDEGFMVIYTHPTRLVTSGFWDKPFFKAKRTPIKDAPSAPLHTAEEVQTHKDRVRRFLDFVQAKEGVRFTDYSTLYAEIGKDRRDLNALMDECGLKPGEEGQLPLRDDKQSWLLPDEFDRIPYGWSVLPKGFTGEQLMRQAKQLTWTSGPALRD